MRGSPAPWVRLVGIALPFVLLVGSGGAGSIAGPLAVPHGDRPALTNASALSSFSAALGRLVTLVAAAGGALLALVWTRVALSWFSNDVAKKVQAKDRARDALVGSLLFAAAVSGLVWGLAQWVVGGS